MRAQTQCLTDEAMALLIDGASGRKERREWLAHLDTCGDCRTVLAEVAHFAERRWPGSGTPGRLDVVLHPSWRLGAAVLGLAAVAVVLLNPFTAHDRLEARDLAIALLSDADSVTATEYAELRWTSDDATRGFADAVSESEIGFRTGLHLVDLEVCRDAGRTHAVSEIQAELSALGRLSGAEGEPDSLSGLAREAAALGAWSEAGRLASARDHAPFFSTEAFVRLRRELDRESLTPPVRSELATIDELLASGLEHGGPERFDELERAFTQIILLY